MFEYPYRINKLVVARAPSEGVFVITCLAIVYITIVLARLAIALPDSPNSPGIDSAVSTESTELSNTKAAMINVGPKLTAVQIKDIQRQIDNCLSQSVETIIWRISGRGRSFERFADLARRIALLAEKKNIHTVAYVPTEAKGMSMLAVFACKEIIADRYSQIGQIIPPRSVAVDIGKGALRGLDEQSIVNKIVGFARHGGHDPLLARAMAQKRLILYDITNGTAKSETYRSENRKIVDQAGFEKYTRQDKNPWRMVGNGPLVGADEVLLLDGRVAFDLALVSHLVDSEDELAKVLGVTITSSTHAKHSLSDEKTILTITDPNSPIKSTIERPGILVEGIEQRAVVIPIKKMVDDGLYQSIKRRSELAIQDGATYLIYEIDTLGGRVDSAIKIHNYLLHDASEKAYTVAYIPTEAISAGALIAVSCRDIIMKKGTKIGDCAPIAMGGKLEGTEREKMESFLRAAFESCADQNNYPAAMCKAMVTMTLEVYQVPNVETGKNEYFETADLENLDPYTYDIDGKTLVVKDNELLTMSAEKAHEFGFARKIVANRNEAIAFLEERDNIAFVRPIEQLQTTWSEELVRKLTHPTVAGILLMIAMLGIYAELNSPGLGLPGAVAVIALAVLFGSKYLVGMANWWEIAVFVVGAMLLLVEIFVIPGFGVAGILGTLMMFFALGAMMVANAPDEWPVPVTPWDWQVFQSNLYGLLGGFLGFLILAYFFNRYLPKIPMANRLVLAGIGDTVQERQGTTIPAPAPEPTVNIGDEGIALSQLRPAGKARIANHRVDVVSRGGLIEPQTKIKVVDIEGNRIVVAKLS